MKKYVYSFDEVGSYEAGENTIKETLRLVKKEHTDEHTEVFIGKPHHLRPKISADNVIDQLMDVAYDEAGENAENYLSSVSNVAFEELETSLNKVLLKWEKKYHEQPTFYTVDNIKVYNIPRK